MDRDQVRRVFMDHGFRVKEGAADLAPYVFNAAAALLDAQAREHQEELARLRAALSGALAALPYVGGATNEVAAACLNLELLPAAVSKTIEELLPVNSELANWLREAISFIGQAGPALESDEHDDDRDLDVTRANLAGWARTLAEGYVKKFYGGRRVGGGKSVAPLELADDEIGVLLRACQSQLAYLFALQLEVRAGFSWPHQGSIDAQIAGLRVVFARLSAQFNQRPGVGAISK